MQLDPDGVAIAGQRLVDRVVDDFVDEVVEATLAGRADVHAGPLADRFEALENRDVGGGVARIRAALGAALLPGSPAPGRTLTSPFFWQENPPKAVLDGCR
jgi:hypothetical protein